MKTAVAMKILAKNKELYDQIAEDFAETRNKIWPEFEYFKGYLANGQDILDLGCGNGRLLELLKDYKINYLGIDYSSKLIDEAKKDWLASQSGPKYNFKVADILDLNLKEKFDLVFLIATLHHIPSQKLREKVLLNVKSVLKPNGKLLMTNWNLWQKRYLKYIIKYTLLKIAETEKGTNGIKPQDLDLQDVFIPWQKKYQRYIHAFTENNIARLLKKAGFEIIKNVSNSRNIITVAKIKEQTEKEKRKMAKMLIKI
jgi:2-polyprenyl-3-methyl-5-hydroxy-6-metoxy-1,4-benzoquinol methylase